jgi:hypothetical protein
MDRTEEVREKEVRSSIPKAPSSHVRMTPDERKEALVFLFGFAILIALAVGCIVSYLNVYMERLP